MARSGKKAWAIQAWEVPANPGTFGLGYTPTEEELNASRKGPRRNEKPKDLYIGSMNGIFCKEGEKVPYYGFDKGGYSVQARKRRSGFEIFTDVLFSTKDKDVNDLQMEEFMQPNLFDEVVVIFEADDGEDSINLIRPAKDLLANWSFEEESLATALPRPSLSPSLALGSSFSFESDQNSRL